MNKLWTAVLFVGTLFGQTTPNLHLNIPTPGSAVNNWGQLLNNNFSSLDSYLSGGSVLGNINACLLNGVAHVGGQCAAYWGSGDIGGQINAAYNSMPSGGGHIHVVPGLYSFTTPIVLATTAKPATLSCDPGAGGYQTVTGVTVLNFTPTSGTAINIAGGSGNQLNGCTLLGPGASSSAVGLLLGGSTGGSSALESLVANNNISNFGTGVQFGQNAFIDLFLNNVIHDNGASGGSNNIYVPASLSEFGENVSFVGGAITNNPVSSSFSTSCINILTSGSIHFYGVSIDQCGVTINAAGGMVVDFVSDHFENPVWPTSSDFITLGANCASCVLNIVGGDVFEQGSSARTELITDNSTVSNTSDSISITGTSFTPQESSVVVKFNGSASCCQRVAMRDGLLGSNVTTSFAGTWLGTIAEAGGGWSGTGVLSGGVLEQSSANRFSGTAACSSSVKTINFPITFTSQPTIILFDETTKGGINLSTKSTSSFAVSCTGATDAFDWIAVGNPN